MVVGAAILLSGCSLLPGGAGAALDGEWQLQAGTNQGQPIPIVNQGKITLSINGARVGGNAACNQYGGKLLADGAVITITELIQTEMACLDNRLMASEAAYLAALPRVTSAAHNGNTLVLSGPQVELRYAFVPAVSAADLVGTVWVLDSLISGDAVSSTVGNEATLTLGADGTLSGSTGCRTFSGRYTISGNQVQVTLDPYDTIGCPNGLGDQDAHVLAVIAKEFGVAVVGNSLTLTAGSKGLGYRARL